MEESKKWATCAALKCFHNGIILIVISKKLYGKDNKKIASMQVL